MASSSEIQTAPELRRHLNQVQLARRWTLSPRTLERWRWLKQGPDYLRVGGRIVYPLVDIEAYEHRNKKAINGEENRR